MENQNIQQIKVKDDSQIVQKGDQLVVEARNIAIKDDLSCNEAVEFGKRIKAFLKGPGTYHDEEIEIANKLHKSLTSKRNAIISGPKQAYKILKDRIAEYQYQQHLKAEEAKRKADAEARRVEAEKQAKIQARIDAENAKIEAEKKAERERQAQEDAKIKAQEDAKERERLEAEAKERRDQESKKIELQEQRSALKVEVLQDKKDEVYVQPNHVAPVTATKNVTVKFDYEPIVTDKSLVPDTYMVVDLAMLKKMQKAANGKLEVAGVRWNKKPIGSIRG